VQHESTNGTSGETLVIPMAWLCAEYIADEMLRSGALVDPGTLEYRAGRETLALTVFLSDGESGHRDRGTDGYGAAHSVARIEEWLRLTSYGHPWEQWALAGLTAREEEARRLGGRPDPGLALARTSWDWLRQTELLATDLGDGEPWRPGNPLDAGLDEREQIWTPAWQLGLPLSHLAVHLF
jgi:hypothetical protein